jgi:nicotinic acid mononucleotide adenylyltransferase
MTRNLPALFIAFALFGQTSHQTPGSLPEPTPPNGKSQSEELLKQDHKKNLADAAQMAKLAEEVSEDLEKDDRYVYSLKTLKKLDDIEKLSKAIRGRLKRF